MLVVSASRHRTLQAEHNALFDRLASSERDNLRLREEVKQHQQDTRLQTDLAFYKGLAENLLKFGHSIGHIGESFGYLNARLDENNQRAQDVAGAAIQNKLKFGQLAFIPSCCSMGWMSVAARS